MMRITLFIALLLLATFPGNGQVSDSVSTSEIITQTDTLSNLKSDTIPEAIVSKDTILQDTVTIIGVGDIMMGTNFPDASYMPYGDGSQLLSEVNKYLLDADITFGNLEGVVLDSGGTAKKCRNPETCYLFRTPSKFLNNLKVAGFDLLSTANNHVNDFGLEGRNKTAKALEEYELNYAGYVNKPTVIIEQNGLKIGLAAFSPNQGTSSIFNVPKAKSIVASLDSLVDIVIVSIHGGGEGKDYQHITREKEFYLGNARGNIYEFSRQMIDSGADIIFGHGPHVTRAVDLYKDRFIVYSMGNFCTYRRFNLSGPNGFAPIMKVYTDSRGKFIQAEVISVRQNPPGGPKIDENNTAFNYISVLTSEDIPEAQLKFNLPYIYPFKK